MLRITSFSLIPCIILVFASCASESPADAWLSEAKENAQEQGCSLAITGNSDWQSITGTLVAQSEPKILYGSVQHGQRSAEGTLDWALMLPRSPLGCGSTAYRSEPGELRFILGPRKEKDLDSSKPKQSTWAASYRIVELAIRPDEPTSTFSLKAELDELRDAGAGNEKELLQSALSTIDWQIHVEESCARVRASCDPEPPADPFAPGTYSLRP